MISGIMVADDYQSIKIRASTKARLKHYMHQHELDSLDAALILALDRAEGKP